MKAEHSLAACVAAGTLLVAQLAAAQSMTGALVGTVKDEHGAVLRDARVKVSSPALIGGSASTTTNDAGQWRYPVLAPGSYVVDVELTGFAAYHEEELRIGAGATLSRTVVLKPAGIGVSIVVEGSGSRIEARGSGFETRLGPEYLTTIPTRRFSMFDAIRSAAGVSPTSPSSGTVNTVAAFGSGGNENLFLIDGTNFTCPCSGVARAEPGVDVIQEVQVQSVGVSAEYGNIQGTVFNVVTKQGSNRFQYRRVVLRAGVRPDQSAGGARGAWGPVENRVRARTLQGLRHEPWRTGGARQDLVLRRLPVPARLRQPARHGTDAPEEVRAGQDLREAHMEGDAGSARGPQLPRRVLGESAGPDTCDAVRRDAAAECLCADHDIRAGDARGVRQHALGGARRTIRVFTRRRPELGRSSDAEQIRSADGCLERKRPELRRADSHPDDGEGDTHALPAAGCSRSITS